MMVNYKDHQINDYLGSVVEIGDVYDVHQRTMSPEVVEMQCDIVGVIVHDE
jgi:hypothetical protein